MDILSNIWGNIQFLAFPSPTFWYPTIFVSNFLVSAHLLFLTRRFLKKIFDTNNVTVMMNARMVFFVDQITVWILFILPLKLIVGNINFCTTLMWKIETMLILVNSVNSLLQKPEGSNCWTVENVYVMSSGLFWSPNNNNTDFCCKMSQFGNSDGSTIAIPR